MHALLVIDVQNDFCPGGKLAVPDGDQIIPIINQLTLFFDCVVQTQDWHPIKHSSFASNHQNKKPHDIVSMNYGEQVLWPNHCVQESRGAEFHPDLETKNTNMIIRKGFRPEIDSYSAFFENDKTTNTGLKGYLDSLNIETVYIVGLATDFCVKWSALDAIKCGYKTYVLEDAVRGIDIDNSVDKAIKEMKEAGVEFITSSSLGSFLMTDQYFDFCILGAGLAGLSLAKELSELSPDSKILVVDPNGIGGGASGSPIGLANPATGRFANKSWRAEESVKAIKENLLEASKFSSETFFKSNGVIRPAMDSKIAQRMKENVDTTDWAEGWCIWMDEEEINQKFPNLTCKDGGVWISEGVTVAIPAYLNALAEKLKHEEVEIISNLEYDVHSSESSDKNLKSESNWKLQLENGNECYIKNLVVTAGIKSVEFDFWKDIPIHPIKGQVAVFECDDEFPYEAAVSATGYFASIDKKTFVAGSTYEHKFDHEGTDEKGLNYVQNRLLRVIPQLKDKIHLIDQWSGVRASTRDRMPILGDHPTISNCSVLAALGSKGLLYSSLLSKELATHLLIGDNISKEVSLKRFS